MSTMRCPAAGSLLASRVGRCRAGRPPPRNGEGARGSLPPLGLRSLSAHWLRVRATSTSPSSPMTSTSTVASPASMAAKGAPAAVADAKSPESPVAPAKVGRRLDRAGEVALSHVVAGRQPDQTAVVEGRCAARVRGTEGGQPCRHAAVPLCRYAVERAAGLSRIANQAARPTLQMPAAGRIKAGRWVPPGG